MGCLVLVSPTRGLGPAETSYSFHPQTGKVLSSHSSFLGKKRHFSLFKISIQRASLLHIVCGIDKSLPFFSFLP
jgi:hypothetical protein